MKTFKASLDNLSKGLTVFCIVLSIFVPVSILIPLYTNHQLPFMAYVTVGFVTLIVWVVIIAMYLYRPLEYDVDEKLFSIKMPVRRSKISRLNIKQVRVVEPEELRFVIRTFGNGGIFGYTGWYYNRQIGKMRWFATQRKNYILIETIDNKRIIITPDDPDGFLKEIS
jgi:hypothetical protein